MTEQRNESIQLDDIQIFIRREATHELYIALQPPEALAYMVAPLDAKPDELLAFVDQWKDSIKDMRYDMIKRFEKSHSLKCRYKTGDVAYLFGRPFMLRVFPLSRKKRTKSLRVRSNINATVRSEVSVIDLFLLNVGDYDQGRLAFLAFAKPVFANNVINLVQQSMERMLPGQRVPRVVKTRPMRDSRVHIDDTKDVVWFSEDLIPYPPDCVVYAFLVELIKQRIPEATEEETEALLDKGVPNWKVFKQILADQNSPYSNQ